MKEIKDREQLTHYLEIHQIASIFNANITPHLALFSYGQGERICSQGDPAEYLYILVKGKVKVCNTSAEGKALIISFKTALEAIGDIEYVQGIDFMNSVEAVSPVHLIGVHNRWLHQYGTNDAELLRFLLKIITSKFCMKSDSLSFNLMYPVEARVASYLLSISYDESDPRFNGQLSAVSLRDVANFIGTSYRHLNRVIHKFCEEDLVERSRVFICVKDRERLRALAGHNIYEK
ncbi:cyclic nucleotide-binding domain-containing protein [Paenibacillus albiflavus]|uniref:Cyclic nucleotide-binding domain-containing protein n=1 Tax=Paenibacillus albiflavus TaxID=2545760 RepID=A0A4R4DYS7_9BACL|nr:cyclic nucleotide-binding domain-containing protein [Paenibacillus albiflavus]TCZ70939.1 cyclic nucleotide-binding domain-containing protein [Paenibacillus albiflavus]